MVFILKINTQDGLRPKLKGESTSGVVMIKSEISVPLVTQGIFDLPARGRRKELKA